MRAGIMQCVRKLKLWPINYPSPVEVWKISLLDLTLRAFNDISDMSHTMEFFVIIWSGHHPSLQGDRKY